MGRPVCRLIAAAAIACSCALALGAAWQSSSDGVLPAAGLFLPAPPPPSSTPETNEEIQQAKRKLQAGSTDQAIALLRRVIQREPGNADAHLLLGTALALVPRESEALAELRRAVALRSNFAPGYYTLGTALARFADPKAATEAFQKALALDPKFADARVSLGLVLAQQKELDGAREQFEKAVSLEGETPTAAYSHYLLARVLAQQKKYSEAQRELETAVRLRPNYAEAYLSQGIIRKNLGDDAGALRSFRKAAAIDPGNAEAQHEMGGEYLRLGQAGLAVEPLEKAARLRPDDRHVLYQLCQALEKTHRAEEARACQQKLAALVRTELDARDHLATAGRLNNEGVTLEEDGDLPGALEKYRAAVRLDLYRTEFRRNLALALCRLGLWDEGIAELREVLRRDPGDLEATKALYIALENARAAKTPGATGTKNPSAPK